MNEASERKSLAEEIRVILSDKKLGDLDEDQREIYQAFSSALSLAYGRAVTLPEARAKLDFLVQLDLKREELNEKIIELREDALTSYTIAKTALQKDPQFKNTIKRGLDRVEQLLKECFVDPEKKGKSILKITFFNETRKLKGEEAADRNLPEDSTEFTGIMIISIVLDTAERGVI